MQQMSTEMVAREMYEELFNRGNVAVLDRYVDPAFVYRNPMRAVKGRQQIVDLVQAQRDAFGDFRMKVDFVVANDASVAVSWTVTGRHTKQFLTYPSTGRTIAFSGITIHRFENGRDVEAWSFSNMDEQLRNR
jgi:steroid delta-isomerase-like uncharacterized protein